MAGTATTEVKNSIVVFTVCLVTPEPERAYVRKRLVNHPFGEGWRDAMLEG
jgi:hypothetical protein